MFKKIATATVLVVGLSSAAIVSTATPAAAFSDGATAAIGLGAFAVGAMAGGAMNGGYVENRVIYHDCYLARRPVYNPWGDVVGFRRARICD